MGVKRRTYLFCHDTIRPVIDKFCLQISGNYLRIRGVYDRGQARMGFRRRQPQQDVCLQKVLNKSGIKIGEGFRIPNTFFRLFKQPLKSNYTSCAEA